MKKITIAVIGAGMRGTYSYAPYALKYPNQVEIVAVAEPISERLEVFKDKYHINGDMCFSSWEQLLSGGKIADAVIIATQDRMHTAPALKALEKEYDVLLEKPMSFNLEECIAITNAVEKYDRKLLVCHVLRYTTFYQTLKRLLDEKRIGDLISVQHNENVGYWHGAHSFVRGNWNNSNDTSPMILAKCCHDMDILNWLVGSKCVNVSSFGSLKHFKAQNAPENAPKYCLEGCPEEDQCPYNALKLYIPPIYDFLGTAAFGEEKDVSKQMEILKKSPYGRCVYKCNNNVVDHQVVNLVFENEVTVAMTMCNFTKECNRTMKFMGSMGEIRAHMEENIIEISDFRTGLMEKIIIPTNTSGHGGGDSGIMKDFIRLLTNQEEKCTALTDARTSLESHIIAFAAEKSRTENRIVSISELTDVN